MTDLIKQAIDALGRLPIDRQEDLARYMLKLARDVHEHHALSPEEAAAIAEAEAQLARGDRVPDETMREFWNRSGL